MTFAFEQVLDVPHPRVANFFSDVKNLARISPPFPRLLVSAPSTAVVAGAQFALRLDFGFFQLRWDSVIDHVEEGNSFTDTFSGQILRRWRHTHTFVPAGSGTRLVDRIECEPVWWFRPFAWVGVHMLFLYRRLAIARALR